MSNNLYLRIRHLMFKPILYFFVGCLACAALCWGIYWIIELRPQYIELEPPTRDGIWTWDFTVHSTLKWENDAGGGRYYLWRQADFCSKRECGSKSEIIEYFSEWLKSEGWTPTTLENPCWAVISEIDLLEEDSYVVYWPSDTEVWHYGPSVCLAVYSTSDGDIGYWDIVIGTTNPSPLTAFAHAWD